MVVVGVLAPVLPALGPLAPVGVGLEEEMDGVVVQ